MLILMPRSRQVLFHAPNNAAVDEAYPAGFRYCVWPSLGALPPGKESAAREADADGTTLAASPPLTATERCLLLRSGFQRALRSSEHIFRLLKPPISTGSAAVVLRH
jgi:hypothetical protein